MPVDDTKHSTPSEVRPPGSCNVHRLTAAGPIFTPPAEIIERLRDLLAEAERGEIKGIGFFLVDGADSVTTGWQSGCAPMNLMVAGAAILQCRVTREGS